MEAIFQRVQEAQDVLADESKRRAYDTESRHFDSEEIADKILEVRREPCSLFKPERKGI